MGKPVLTKRTKLFGTRDLRKQVRRKGGYMEPSGNGHDLIKDQFGNTVGTAPANRKEFKRGTGRSILKMLEAAGMLVLGAGTFSGILYLLLSL